MSDRSARDRKGARAAGIIVGTAGHIDHGKTSLIRALTGIDTDRLAEEKKRGISIDIGFAHLTLPDGRRISFIDVPGHERFIKNMLAGAGGIQAVLLVVAADEAVKPQTREHFEICRLLGVQHGIVVMTKSDLVAAERMREACDQAKALCAGSFLDGAPILPVSAITGAGLGELKRELGRVAERAPERDAGGLARLPIDRSFALKGFGTVVTGTLWSGGLRTGDTVQIHPFNAEARVRGLQVHGQPVDVALAGQRTAVNLAGIDHADIRRGFELTHKDGLETTRVVDVSIDWLDAEDIPHARAQFLFHIATAEIPVMLKVLSMEMPSRTLARLRLAEPVIALPGDRFIVRRPSPGQTVGGGFVIDAFPLVRFNRSKTIARLERMVQADFARRLEILIEESATGRLVTELVRLTGRPLGEIRAVLASNPKLATDPAGQRVVTAAWIAERRKQLQNWLTAYHAKNPSAAGAPIALARLGLDAALAQMVFHGAPAIRVERDLVSLATHKAQFSDPEMQAMARIERAFRDAGIQPAAPPDVLAAAKINGPNARGLLEVLIKSQKLVRVSPDLVFHADVIAHIRKSVSAHKGRRFSVPEFKEWTQISRKYAIPLLEYLDHQRVTRRDGDSRIVL
jgi:selenocysteine-specific elongation factor